MAEEKAKTAPAKRPPPLRPEYVVKNKKGEFFDVSDLMACRRSYSSLASDDGFLCCKRLREDWNSNSCAMCAKFPGDTDLVGRVLMDPRAPRLAPEVMAAARAYALENFVRVP